MRYPVAGNITSIVSTGTPISLIGQTITPGREFFLRQAYFQNLTGQTQVALVDVSAGATFTSTNYRAILTCASAASTVGRLFSTTKSTPRTFAGEGMTSFVFEPPGLKFTDGCCIIVTSASGGAGTGIGFINTTTASYNAESIAGGIGYEE